MLGLDFVKKLKPAVFQYKPEHLRKEHHKVHFGFMAQDIAKLLDDDTKYAILKRDNENFYMVDHGELIAPLVKAVQELTNKVEELEGIIKHERDRD